jgi:hypothetical protein
MCSLEGLGLFLFWNVPGIDDWQCSAAFVVLVQKIATLASEYPLLVIAKSLQEMNNAKYMGLFENSTPQK